MPHTLGANDLLANAWLDAAGALAEHYLGHWGLAAPDPAMPSVRGLSHPLDCRTPLFLGRRLRAGRLNPQGRIGGDVDLKAVVLTVRSRKTVRRATSR